MEVIFRARLAKRTHQNRRTFTMRIARPLMASRTVVSACARVL